jgi:RimJ/RimL family protein N-acetyltransferase
MELDLRPISVDDGDVLCDLVSHPEVWEWLMPKGDSGPAVLAQCRAWARRDAAHWELHGFGKWLVLEGERPVGRGGLGVTFVEGRPEVEMGWAVERSQWRRGIATWIARAALDEAERLGLLGVVAFSRPENHASVRVIEKAGLLFEREVSHAGWPHVLYRAAA